MGNSFVKHPNGGESAAMAGGQLEESHFPGYSERLSEAEQEARDKRLNFARKGVSNSAEKIGIRSEFNFGEESKVDLYYIY